MSEEAVIYRDKDGKKIGRDEWIKLQGKKDDKKKRRRDQRPAPEWGTGLVQQQQQEDRQKEEAEISAQPITRYDIDEKYDVELRNRTRDGDPMAEFQDSDDSERKAHKKREKALKKEERKKEKQERKRLKRGEGGDGQPDGSEHTSREGAVTGPDDGQANRDSTGESKKEASGSWGGYPPGLPPVPRPKCRYATPPNRFEIQAGYRWDGVVRGVGFEEKLMTVSNIFAPVC
eukprot:GHVU01131400.1.p1 GENE.GHVU01131400.1~~GHVU01131400.1.p1  ORF type:complete len:231 (+),score=51.60 GHVU01131400.1:453-1145(+)